VVTLQKSDVEAIEKVQKRATKLVISLKKVPYTDCLFHLGLPTIKYRRLHGDMIEVCNALHGMQTRSSDEKAVHLSKA